MADFPGKGKVAVLRTTPETVLADIGRAMVMAGYREALPRDRETILKINITWDTWYPGCSTTPWQLEGVIRRLKADGYGHLIAAHNRTVVVDAYKGERNNKHKYVVEKYGVENIHLYEPHVEWVPYEPKGELLVLHKIFPEGIRIPKLFIGRNIIHLPTVKTHVFTTITGAMKNAFGGLLNERRHWTHAVIHETLVDLLTIQQEIHPGIFAVMDGTFAGDGPGPRAMRPHEKDIILASADQVAIDAMSAKLQGSTRSRFRLSGSPTNVGWGLVTHAKSRLLVRTSPMSPGGSSLETRLQVADKSSSTTVLSSHSRTCFCAPRLFPGRTSRRTSITMFIGIQCMADDASSKLYRRSGGSCS